MERDRPVIELLNGQVARRPRWGFWKLYDRLRLDGHGINHKRLHRVYRAMKLNLPRRTKHRLPQRLRQPLLAPQRLNEIWALDFMADALYGWRPFRTLNVIDEGNREALDIEVATSIPARRVIRVMERLIELYGKPLALRLDNGSELTSTALTEWCAEQLIELRFIQPGKLIDCVAGASEAGQCAVAWAEAATPLMGGGEAARREARGYAEYYVGMLRANGGKSADCRAQMKGDCAGR
jgi:putative transposase